ncbi:MAG: Lrp/AsnC family transcriptional regulator [Candidatus Aenigmarchaeota archaeon]|nr:Lrp/AsnC family transcriptional regulator [Candidatus Aenigmarchaeota archaeon]
MPIRDKEKQVLFELLKNGRKPDKHIAQILKLTQPTVTRIRQRLEGDKIIRGYRATVDEKAAGLSISAITFFDWRDYSEKEQIGEALNYMAKMPEVIYFAQGEGLRGKTFVMMTFHKTFAGYQEFTKKLRERYGKQIAYIEEFISSTDAIHKRDPTQAFIHAMSD